MGPLTFITDEAQKRFAQLNLAEVAQLNEEELEDLMDVIIAEARKSDEKITLEELEIELKAEGYL